MSKAKFEIPTPNSCFACPLQRVVTSFDGTSRRCLIAKRFLLVWEYDKERHPDCPLKVESE